MTSLISLLRPCIAEPLLGSSSLQVFPKPSSSSSLSFEDAAHTLSFNPSERCWCAPTHMLTECTGWRQGVSNNPCRGMEVHYGCCFLWGQWVNNIRDSSPSSCPPHTQNLRWIVCPHSSDTFLKYLPTADEVLLYAKTSL